MAHATQLMKGSGTPASVPTTPYRSHAAHSNTPACRRALADSMFFCGLRPEAGRGAFGGVIFLRC
eukprot:15475771-Alexandrium_andersonii.AAC.1